MRGHRVVRRAALVVIALAALLLAGCGEPHPPSHRAFADGLVMETSDSTFERDVFGSGKPTLVYFWAPGCIPCIPAGAAVKRAAPRFAGRVTFWKYDMGWSAARVQKTGIAAWPAFGLYVGDRQVQRQIGVWSSHTDDSLAAWVEEGLRRARADSAR